MKFLATFIIAALILSSETRAHEIKINSPYLIGDEVYVQEGARLTKGRIVGICVNESELFYKILDTRARRMYEVTIGKLQAMQPTIETK